MERKRFDKQPCPVARAVDLFGDWWIPMILREALYGVTQFNDFQRNLDISKNILHQRLQRMLVEGLMEKTGVHYRLTQKGSEAVNILAAMAAWSNRWVFDESSRPIHLVDRKNGGVLEPRVIDSKSGRPLETFDVAMQPGPGFPPDPDIRNWRFGSKANNASQDRNRSRPIKY